MPPSRPVADWLTDHEISCRRLAQRWMHDCWPVPVALLRELWPDPAWQAALRGTIVTAPGLAAAPLKEIVEDGAEVHTPGGGVAHAAASHLTWTRNRGIPEEVAKLAAELGYQDPIAQLTSTYPAISHHKYQRQAEFDWERHRRLRVGLAPVGPETADRLDAPGHPVEQAVRVRVYRHPELGERRVIALLPDTDAVGMDLHAADVGCAPPEVGPPVAAAKRAALLGYPAWAAVHDPASKVALDGHRALNEARRTALTDPKRALRDLRRYAETSLPAGHAPAFWWEASDRVFFALHYYWDDQCEGTKQSRAESRNACRPAGLLADLDLWYALARDEHADLAECCAALARRDGPEAAHDAFREVALRRTWGGVPFKELREFAEAAGRGGVEQDALDLGFHARHHGEVFLIPDATLKARRKAFVHLARTDDVSLRILFSEPYQLHVLARTGVLASLLKDAQVAERLLGGVLWPDSSPSEWLDRQYGENLRSVEVYAPCLDLLAFLAPALAEDERGIDLRGPGALNALDVACEHGVPLSHPVRETDLDAWLRSKPDVRRPLAHAAADPRCREALLEAVARFGEPRKLLDYPALAPLAAEAHPELAGSVGSPSDEVLRRALECFGVLAPSTGDDRISTVRSMRAAMARMRGEDAETPGTPAVHWALLAEHLGALAVRAASPATPDDERAALVEFLAQWAETPLLTGGWRCGTAPGDGAIPLYEWEGETWYAHRAPADSADPGWATPERLTAFLEALAERGPLRWGKNAQEEAARLDLGDAPEPAATLLFGGLPGLTARGDLPADRRKALKLKTDGINAARRRLAALDAPTRLRLCAAVPPPDPASWWGRDGWTGAADRVAARLPG
ncbi:hypothetical protein ACIBF1_15365 [Spirillospora sp. NPDC050679]